MVCFLLKPDYSCTDAHLQFCGRIVFILGSPNPLFLTGLDRPAARDRRQPPAAQLASLRPCWRRAHRGDHRQGGCAPHGVLAPGQDRAREQAGRCGLGATKRPKPRERGFSHVFTHPYVQRPKALQKTSYGTPLKHREVIVSGLRGTVQSSR